ncbi:hypothetical protein FCV25MIE_25506 [Fagus crenata]
MSTNPWGGGIGAWVADAERAEEEEATTAATATATSAESSQSHCFTTGKRISVCDWRRLLCGVVLMVVFSSAMAA